MSYPFVPARHHGSKRGAPTVVVLHSMEAPERATTAEDVANYFARTNRKASVHYNVDNDSIVQSVADNVVAYGAGGSNPWGLHIEHAGYAAQTRAQWLDAYGQDMLLRSASLVADKCIEHRIFPRWLSADMLRAGQRNGITTHVEVTWAFRKSTHTDPGPHFPLGDYLALVQRIYRDRIGAVAPAEPAPPVTPNPPNPPAPGPIDWQLLANLKRLAQDRTPLRRGSRGGAVAEVQQAINDIVGHQVLTPDGIYGAATERWVRQYQADRSLAADGIVGVQTWIRLALDNLARST